MDPSSLALEGGEAVFIGKRWHTLIKKHIVHHHYDKALAAEEEEEEEESDVL